MLHLGAVTLHHHLLLVLVVADRTGVRSCMQDACSGRLKIRLTKDGEHTIGDFPM